MSKRKRSRVLALIGAAIGSVFMLAVGFEPLNVAVAAILAVAAVEIAGG